MCKANTLQVQAPSSEKEFDVGTGEVPLKLRSSSLQMVDEFKELMKIAMPLAGANGIAYARLMISVLCLGRLGGIHLAGGALSIGFTNITGYSVLYGLASGMDPICGQAFGSKNWHIVGLTLHRTILILLTACIPISFLWMNMGPIMLFLRQDPGITAVASVYCWYSLPDLIANSLLQPLRNYLRCQGYTAPMMWCQALAVLLHIPLSVILAFVCGLGVPGVAIAAAWTNFNIVTFMCLYVCYFGTCKNTWVNFSSSCFQEWWPLLRLALPSCLQICLEWWWYEIMTILAGYLPNPQVAVAGTAILIQTTALMYTIPMSLGSSVSTRVGNEIGANRPEKARNASIVSLVCAFVVAIVSILWTTIFRHQWGHLYTSEESVLALTAAVLPLIGLCELGNCPQTAGCGILRGSARPTIAAIIMFVSFYIVGTPVAVALAFWFKIGFRGLWHGLLAAQICCACSILLVTLRIDWASECVKANRLTSSGLSAEEEDEEKVALTSNTVPTYKLDYIEIVKIGDEETRRLVDGEAITKSSNREGRIT